VGNERIPFASVHVFAHVHAFVNKFPIVNMKVLSGAALEKALAVRLEELLRGVDWLRGWQVEHVGGTSDAGFDLLATVPLPGGGKAVLCVECRAELRPSVFRTLAGRSFSPAGQPKVVVPVLALPWVSPRVAELCAEHGGNGVTSKHSTFWYEGRGLRWMGPFGLGFRSVWPFRASSGNPLAHGE
jgi:hypothetical protein